MTCFTNDRMLMTKLEKFLSNAVKDTNTNTDEQECCKTLQKETDNL